MPTATRSWKRQGTDSPWGLDCSVAAPISDIWPPEWWGVHFCHFKAPSLWCFVRAATEDQNRHVMLTLLRCPGKGYTENDEHERWRLTWVCTPWLYRQWFDIGESKMVLGFLSYICGEWSGVLSFLNLIIREHASSGVFLEMSKDAEGRIRNKMYSLQSLEKVWKLRNITKKRK